MSHTYGIANLIVFGSKLRNEVLNDTLELS